MDHYSNLAITAFKKPATQTALVALGSATALSLVAQLGGFVWQYFLRPSSLPKYLHDSDGSWALVTGSSDGIGRGVAEALLERGFNVLFHGRNADKLKGIIAELAPRFPQRKLDYVVADAASTEEPWKAVVEKARTLPGKLTVLVNNVGGIPFKPSFRLLKDTPSQDVDFTINLNARFPTQLTRALWPVLKQNGPSLIINAGSFTGNNGLPYLATYSATKAFVATFSQGIRGEALHAGDDIDVLGVTIGNVVSGGNKTEASFTTLTSAEAAKEILAKVGCGKAVTFLSWRQAWMMNAMGLVPNASLTAGMAKMMQGMAEKEQKEM